MAQASEQLLLKMDKMPIEEMKVSVDLQFTRLFRIRLWIGIHLLWLLGVVWDCNIDIDYEPDPSRMIER